MKDRILTLLQQHISGTSNKSFVDLAREFRDEGQSQVAVYDAFMEIFSEKVVVDGESVVTDNVESDYMGALDAIYGWCSAHNRLWPTYLGDILNE